MFNSNGEWKRTNVDIQTLVAFILGVASIIGAVIGVQSWIDARIRDHVRPLKKEISRIETELESHKHYDKFNDKTE